MVTFAAIIKIAEFTMNTRSYLAFDIGATSGRAVLGTIEGGIFEMQEIHRFPNAITELHGRYYWNVYRLYDAMKEALHICTCRGIQPDSIGIDTWGVDFGYLAADGSLLALPRAYRDPYTEGMPEEYFRHIPREEVYRLTGIQVMNFNSLYQLLAAHSEGYAPMDQAVRLLFIPDLLAYLLTGKEVCEYTVASTSQLLNPLTMQFEGRLVEAAGADVSLLPKLVMPGTTVGFLTNALAEETGIGRVKVVAVAGHDTASAVAAVPAADRNFAYLSSGTWSLMGIEVEKPIITSASFVHNFTNEGGIDGTIRFLKNITGMWLLEQCRKEWERAGRVYTYPDIVRMAEEEAAPFVRFVYPDDPRFANPAGMTAAIDAYCLETGQPLPEEDADYVRCIFESLAFRYREVLALLSAMAPFPIHCLHVIGGGAKNAFLNQITANALALPVVAGPSEATAIGNCMVQARADGMATDRWDMRRMIRSSESLATFQPEDIGVWEGAFHHYQRVTSINK